MKKTLKKHLRSFVRNWFGDADDARMILNVVKGIITLKIIFGLAQMLLAVLYVALAALFSH